MSTKKLIGVLLMVCGVMDVGIAFVIMPPDLRWILLGSAAVMFLLGGWFFLRSLNDTGR